MILAKAAEIIGLGLFAAVSMIQAAVEGIPQGPLLQLGALGLVGFMVAQNYRQRANIDEVLDRKDAEIHKADARANRLAVEFTDAVNNLTATLAARPCVAAAHEPDKQKGKTT